MQAEGPLNNGVKFKCGFSFSPFYALLLFQLLLQRKFLNCVLEQNVLEYGMQKHLHVCTPLYRLKRQFYYIEGVSTMCYNIIMCKYCLLSFFTSFYSRCPAQSVRSCTECTQHKRKRIKSNIQYNL